MEIYDSDSTIDLSGDEYTANNRTNSDDLWGQLIPIEILTLIFRKAVNDCGSVPFLCRVSKVCRLWRQVSNFHFLWSQLDLSFGWIIKEPIYFISEIENRFSCVNDLNIAGWTKLRSKHFNLIAENCKDLKFINASQTKLDNKSLMTIAKGCDLLEGFNFTSMLSCMNPQVLVDLIDRKRLMLKTFIFSKNFNCKLHPVLKSMSLSCPLLSHLELNDNDMSRSALVVLDIDQMQKAWPNLTILRIINDHIAFRTKKSKQELIGFPKLIELSLTQTKVSSESILDVLEQLIGKSKSLEHLDLRYTSGICFTSLDRLPITHLKDLYIKSDSLLYNINDIIFKCQERLLILDLAWNLFTDSSLDDSLVTLAKLNTSKLEVLNLKGTNILVTTVQQLLIGCKCLQQICLDSCRNLPRGLKRTYNKEEFNKILLGISQLNSSSDGFVRKTSRQI